MSRWSSGTRGLLMSAAILAFGVACTDSPDPKKDTVQTIPEEQITKRVNEFATQIATVAGVALKTIAESAAPCQGRAGELSEDVYTVQGTYQLPVPQAQQTELLSQLRSQWQQQGYQIELDVAPSAGRDARLAAMTPDRYRLSLITTTPPTALSLSVNSGCYKSPTPR